MIKNNYPIKVKNQLIKLKKYKIKITFKVFKLKEVNELKEEINKEIKKNKDLWNANEKQKREKWISEKTQEIKEQTIKGLEPEIEKLL